MKVTNKGEGIMALPAVPEKATCHLYLVTRTRHAYLVTPTSVRFPMPRNASPAGKVTLILLFSEGDEIKVTNEGDE